MTDIVLRLSQCKVSCEEAQRLKERVDKGRGEGIARDTKAIPSLAAPDASAPRADDSLETRIEREAMLAKIEDMEKEAEAITEKDIVELESLLNVHLTPPIINGVRYIRFMAYQRVRSQCPPALAALLTAELFLELRYAELDTHGRVPLLEIIRYVIRHVSIRRNMIRLIHFSHERFLRPEDVNEMLDCLYISRIKQAFDAYPEMRSHINVDPLYYSCFCERRLWFVLDPLRQGKIRSIDLAISGMMDELRLQVEAVERNDMNELQILERPNSWLTLLKCDNVLSVFRELDADANGLLTIDELLEYNRGFCSRLFISRVFDTSRTYDENELDFAGFVDFIQAMEDRARESSLRWLFRVLDLDDNGVLTRAEILAHVDGMLKALDARLGGSDSYNKDDIADEIFDMANPAQPGMITIRDILACKKGDVLLGIMVDALSFDVYEKREDQIAGESDELLE